MAKSATGLGVDQSLRSTGYGFWMDETTHTSDTIPTTNASELIDRHHKIVGTIVSVVRHLGVEHVSLEDYAYGTFGKQPKNAAKLCELGGQLKLALIQEGVTVFVVNTKYVKMWVGLAGNAKKKEVVKAVNLKYGTHFKMSDNDRADALVIARIGQACWERLCGLENVFKLDGHQVGIVEAVILGEDTVLRGKKSEPTT